MTRKSKRELERAVMDLAENRADVAPEDEPVAEHYSEEVRDHVYQLSRNMAVVNDRDAVNLDNPDRTLRHLEWVREKFDIEDDRDEDVYAALEDAAAGSGGEYWGPCDVLMTAMVIGPMHMSPDRRAEYDEMVAAGDDDQAAQIVVEVVYDILANQGSADRTGVTSSHA